MPNLYIIAGCNGAGKTTASYTILPEIPDCKEFVNADNIAEGLSPFNPNGVLMQAEEIMLMRINTLIKQGVDFVIETNLSDKNYSAITQNAIENGYKIERFYRPGLIEKESVFNSNRETGNNTPIKAPTNRNSKLSDFDDLSTRIIDGINKALRELVETTAAKDGTLVVSDGKGNPRLVPAKELLKNFPKQEL